MGVIGVCRGVLQIRPADLCLRVGLDGLATFEWQRAVVRHEFHACHWGEKYARVAVNRN